MKRSLFKRPLPPKKKAVVVEKVEDVKAEEKRPQVRSVPKSKAAPEVGKDG